MSKPPVPGKKFMPGVSGNPGGQTKAQAAARRLCADLVREKTDGGTKLIEFAVRVLAGEEDDCTDGKSRRWACEFLADRLWGRAPLIVEVTEDATEATQALPDVRSMPIAELRARAGRAAAPPADPAPETPPGDDPTVH